MKKIKLTGIYIYPIKSLGGIELKNSEVEKRGLKYDRRWMLVDENGKFITQRSNPELAKFQLSFCKNGFEIIHLPTKESIEMPLESITETIISVEVWSDIVESVIVSEKISKWFTEKLNRKCELVYMPESSIRKVEEKPWVNNEIVSFADAYPFLLISEESLADLNSRLSVKIKMDRFRPNLVVAGCRSYEEDEWSEVKIGDITFKLVKPCARCVITTIDQQTGEKNAEPLEKMAEYRKSGNKIMFGQNLLHITDGSLSLDDKIEVIKRKQL